jgi:hypothetical protein
MGDNSPVEVTDKGRIKLTNVSFENVLHVPKLSVNILFVYQMTNFSIGKRAIFRPDAVDIYDMKTNSRVSTSEVNHQSRLYTFFEFIEPDSALLLIHADESSRIWNIRFVHLILDICNILASNEWLMVYLTSTSPKEFVRDVFLENTLKRNSTKERLRRLHFL